MRNGSPAASFGSKCSGRCAARTAVRRPRCARAEQVLEGIALVAVDEPILRDAAAVEPDRLRSLDAVHLATALSLDELEALVTYDAPARSRRRAGGCRCRVSGVTLRLTWS